MRPGLEPRSYRMVIINSDRRLSFAEMSGIGFIAARHLLSNNFLDVSLSYKPEEDFLV
jgi:hypothetical protein